MLKLSSRNTPKPARQRYLGVDMAYVYQHVRLDKNEPFYIGVGTSPKRAYSKFARNNIWVKIVKKAGYKVEIVFDNISRKEALEKEKELIKKYGRIDKKTGILSNMTDGGDGGTGHIKSEELCKKMSELYKERIKKDRSMVEAMHRHNRGRPLSEETKRKLSESKKGRKLTEEHKAKLRGRPAPSKSPEVRKRLSELFKGRPISEEQKKRISQTLMGRSNGPWKPSQYEKNKNYWKSVYSPITQFSKEGEFIKVWYNRIIASEELGIPKNHIRENLRGRKKLKDYIFKFGDCS